MPSEARPVGVVVGNAASIDPPRASVRASKNSGWRSIAVAPSPSTRHTTALAHEPTPRSSEYRSTPSAAAADVSTCPKPRFDRCSISYGRQQVDATSVGARRSS